MGAEIEDLVAKISQLVTAYLGIVIILGTIPYLLRSYGIYKVGKRNNLKSIWLSWIPIMRYHVVSQVADYFRLSVGKSKKITTGFEITTFICAILILAAIMLKNILILIPLIILFPILKLYQTFGTYYFYKFCDKENATIFFVLGLVSPIFNTFFIFNCRDKGSRGQYSIYR